MHGTDGRLESSRDRATGSDDEATSVSVSSSFETQEIIFYKFNVMSTVGRDFCVIWHRKDKFSPQSIILAFCARRRARGGRVLSDACSLTKLLWHGNSIRFDF